MFEGKVVSISIAEKHGGTIESLEKVKAIAGKGLEGDRFTVKNYRGLEGQVSLIEIEAIEALKRDYNIDIKPEDARRNIVTRGVPLNHLLNKEFLVGEVKLKGLALREPCGGLEEMTEKGVLKGLIHRGGLGAQILSDGTIKKGDVIKEK